MRVGYRWGRRRWGSDLLFGFWALEFFFGDVLGADAFESVQGGDFVGFGEGGVVEDGVDEVGDGAAVAHDGLADVDEFCGGFSHDVYAEQLPGLLIEDEFQDAGVVACDGAAGHFAEASDTDFVGDAFFGEFLFGLSNDGDFRDGVDAVGHEMGVGFVGCAEGVAGGLSALFHGGGGESGKSDDVAGGVDVGDAGLEIVVHFDEITIPQFYACGFEIEGAGVA